jgi:multidrug resistance protein MdtO
VIPRLDDIVGLLLMTLPIVALAAWISAGSERISYAGIQLIFTFSLALLERFGPTTDLTDIRDRLVGILLGVGVATVVQTAFWREGEGDVLRGKLATMLRAIAAQLADARSEEALLTQRQLQAWTALADCEATLARVALEPDWRDGEQARLTMKAQITLAQAREIMLAGNALRDALASVETDPHSPAWQAAQAVRDHARDALDQYADALATPDRTVRAPSSVRVGAHEPVSGAPPIACAQELARQVAALPEWQEEVSDSVISAKQVRT